MSRRVGPKCIPCAAHSVGELPPRIYKEWLPGDIRFYPSSFGGFHRGPGVNNDEAHKPRVLTMMIPAPLSRGAGTLPASASKKSTEWFPELFRHVPGLWFTENLKSMEDCMLLKKTTLFRIGYRAA